MQWGIYALAEGRNWIASHWSALNSSFSAELFKENIPIDWLRSAYLLPLEMLRFAAWLHGWMPFTLMNRLKQAILGMRIYLLSVYMWFGCTKIYFLSLVIAWMWTWTGKHMPVCFYRAYIVRRVVATWEGWGCGNGMSPPKMGQASFNQASPYAG